MRIVHWYPNFLGGGGVANAVAALAAAQGDLGHDVTVVSARSNGAPLYESMEGLTNVALETYGHRLHLRRGSLAVRPPARGTARALGAKRADVVHVHGEFNPDNLWAPRLFDVPLVLSPHGAFHPVVLDKSRSRSKRAYVRAANVLLYRRVALFHGATPSEGADIASLLRHADVYVVPQGAGPRSTTASRRRSDGAPRVVFVGRLDVYTKGLDLLLAAAAAAGSPSLEVRLVGPDTGGAAGKLRMLASRLGVELSLTGALDSAGVARELADADVYAQLSRHEGAPLALAEALRAGLPCVISKAVGTASFPEVRALPGVRVVDPEDDAGAGRALRELLGIGRAGASGALELFSWERSAALHVERYESCIGREVRAA